jgi:uncharacterized protein (TIGR03118 family)
MSKRFKAPRRVALAAAAAAGLMVAAPATAFASTGNAHPAPPRQATENLALHQVNLASNVAGEAPLTDPDLINPWGLSISPGNQVWVSDQGADASTLYQLNPNGDTVTKSTTTRTTMADSTLGPSGTVAYTGKGFVLHNGKASAPAQFMFASLDGHIEAWSANVDPRIGATQDVATVADAAFTGLSIAPTADGGRLFAPDYAAAGSKIYVFNSKFQQVKLPSTAFTDPHLPSGYHAFGTQVIDGNVYVTYDTLGATAGAPGTGAGVGLVDEYTVNGNLIGRVATGGTLDAPWGMAIAPKSWGRDAGALLVGNFGSGEISIFPREGNHFASKAAGVVVNANTGKPFSEPGLWGLLQGTPTDGGTSAIWFSAGLNNQEDGLLGLLRP